MVFITGRRAVREALAGGRRKVIRIHLARTARLIPIINDITREARDRGIAVEKQDGRVLNELAGAVNHQGVVAEVGNYQYESLSDLISKVEGAESALIVVLDGLYDPQNLGAVIRTAHCAGADGLIIPKRRGANVTDGVARASAGAVEHSRIVKYNINSAVERLKQAGFWIVGAAIEAQDLIWEVDMTGRIAVVLGAEEAGLSKLVGSKCDFTVRVPMFGRIGSLNVSAAAAVLIYEAIRQRGQ